MSAIKTVSFTEMQFSLVSSTCIVYSVSQQVWFISQPLLSGRY
jgi:hypothetical protein